MKLCKDCKHYEKEVGFIFTYHNCHRRDSIYTTTINNVTGNSDLHVENNVTLCRTEREGGLIGIIMWTCGKNGRHWRKIK